MLNCIKHVQDLYTACGFISSTFLIDGEFEPLCHHLTELGITLNATSWLKCVPEIEWQICIINEHAYACHHTLPFKLIIKLMAVEMIKNTVM